jgi:hypothetical protein
MIKNSHGKIYYGMHFYPGVAQYQEDNQVPYRVFLNEETIRSMDPSFAGRPIFVEHVDDVEPDLDTLRTEADGWVIESFFNAADGKHWVKFIVVSDEAERAIQSGMRLSNAYIPKSFGNKGLWNGVPYEKEITSAEYEHLAIVENPRYEESVILTPEEFKHYNERNTAELKKLSNSQKGEFKKMKLNFFKRTKVNQPIDSDICVVLPRSGKTVSIAKLVNDADDKLDLKSEGGFDADARKAMAKSRKDAYEPDSDPAMDKKKDGDAGESAKSHTMADMNHMVKMHDGSYMKIKDMMSKHQAMCDEIEDLKGMKKDSKEEELDLEVKPKEVDAEGDLHNDPDSEHDMDEHEEKVAKVEHEEELKDDMEENPEEVVHDDEDEDKGAKKKSLQLAEHEEKEIEEAKAKNKKKNALEKANRLRNAHLKAVQTEPERNIELSEDMVARGRSRYGS